MLGKEGFGVEKPPFPLTLKKGRAQKPPFSLSPQMEKWEFLDSKRPFPA